LVQPIKSTRSLIIKRNLAHNGRELPVRPIKRMHRLPALALFCEHRTAVLARRQRAFFIGVSRSFMGGGRRRFGCAWESSCEACEDVVVDGGVDVRYALSGDARLAFTVRGRGAYQIVWVPAWVSNQDLDLFDALYERELSIATVVSYDQRGSGLSDPVALDDLPTLERWADDLGAVIDAAGVDHAVLYAGALSGPIAMLYAASHPERTRALVLVNTQAALAWSQDYPAGVKPELYERLLSYVEHVWGTGRFIEALAPGSSFDETQLRAAARLERSLPPATVAAIFRQQYHTDVRAILPAISAPTLVLHTVDNPMIRVAHGRYLAEHIPNARLVELPGSDHAIVRGKTARRCTEEIEEFLTGTRPTASHDRMLTTLLFTDLVGSTDRVSSVGDRAWRNLLDHHDAAVRRQLERFSGREQKHTGDGLFATFDGPARAIRCDSTIRDAARQISLDVRVGIHSGEVEQRDTELSGIAVHLASRVCETAQPGEVLVTRTVVDLVAGSGITFEDRGNHTLKGIPTPWQLFAVAT
jgi:class 3 adenylate cyclase